MLTRPGPEEVDALHADLPAARRPLTGGVDRVAHAPDPLLAVLEDLRQSSCTRGAVLLRRRGTAWVPVGAAGIDAVTAARVADEPSARSVPVRLSLDGGDDGLVCFVPAGSAEHARLQPLVAAAGPVLVLAARLRAAERAADTDALTGLANRRAFDEQAGRAFDAHGRGGPDVAVVVCDLNGLKSVNDRAGHDAGDRLLIAVADVLRGVVHDVAGALAVRLGGDEFALLLVGVAEDRVLALAEACCAQVEALADGEGLSCGVATADTVVEPVASLSSLVRLADAAQYRAKRAASTRPVLAGRTQLPVPQGAVPRQRHPMVRALAEGTGRLATMRDAGTKERLEVAAEVLRDHLDPGGWWLSYAAPGSHALRTVAHADVRVHNDHQARVAQMQPDAVFDLREYPRSAQALRGGCFVTELGAPDNDPAEEHMLVVSGFTSMAAAGATDGRGGWLLEVFLDELSVPLPGLDAVLRALVELAVAGA